MKPALAGLLALAAGLAILAWRSQLFTVSRPGERPRPLEVCAAGARVPVALDVVLPAVPAGMRRLRGGEGVLVIHDWAMWERDGRAQAVALDSLRRMAELAGLRVVAVCFDPMPSVARFVGRNRLRLPVLLDSAHQLSRVLPCPSIPYTYVLDRTGRVAVAQPGEIDWLGPETRAALARLMREAPGTDGRDVAPTAAGPHHPWAAAVRATSLDPPAPARAGTSGTRGAASRAP